MAHTGIFATSDEILVKAGHNYDSTNMTEARINALCLQVENEINCLAKYNFSDVFAASLNVDVKYFLSEIASNMVAFYIISFNMSGYTSRVEAEDMLNVLWDRIEFQKKVIADQNTVDFMLKESNLTR